MPTNTLILRLVLDEIAARTGDRSFFKRGFDRELQRHGGAVRPPRRFARCDTLALSSLSAVVYFAVLVVVVIAVSY